MSALHAVTMVRAASEFSDALWVCDHEPELAWLHCAGWKGLIVGPVTLSDLPRDSL